MTMLHDSSDDKAVLNGSPSTSKTDVPPRRYKIEEEPSLEDFKRLCEASLHVERYKLCETAIPNIPLYNLSKYSPEDSDVVDKLQDEWNHILISGPGVFVLKKFFSGQKVIDRTNEIYDRIIAAEAGNTRGDHFAASGKNSRIWNSFQKHAEHDPESFTEYYSNPWLSHVSEAWLGPAYQVTAQVNVVRPGGKPQVAHRDYHLGFQTAESCARFPRAMQVASQLLTLQGAVAHSDMPLDSGPTRFLPFSQLFEQGYMAYRLPQFTDYFNEHWVSVPLDKGDGVFFNPALFHAAGENTTAHVIRSANLLQISSAFGRPMENVNTALVAEKCWDQSIARFRQEKWSIEMVSLVKAISNGYPFPTNLDQRPPAPGGMAPESETDILMRGIEQGWSKERMIEAIGLYKADSSG